MSSLIFTEKNSMIHAALNGEIDNANIGEIKTALYEIISIKPKSIAINFANVETVDSTALAALVFIFRKTSYGKTNLLFYDVRPEIRKIFEVTNLDKIFNIISKEDFEKEYSETFL